MSNETAKYNVVRMFYVCLCVCNGWATAFIDFPINFAHCPHQIALDSRFVQRFRGFIDRSCISALCVHIAYCTIRRPVYYEQIYL